jgi:hypothetical protein
MSRWKAIALVPVLADYEVEEDGRHIHRNYPKWVNNMVHDISVQLLTAAAAPAN